MGGQFITVTAIATQGRSDHDQWVTKYRITYGDDGVRFQYYRENWVIVKVKYAIFMLFLVVVIA